MASKLEELDTLNEDDKYDKYDEKELWNVLLKK